MGNGTRIGQVRGLGSAHHGAHHWLMQRVTAVGNLVSAGFLAISFAMRDDFSYAAIAGWIAQPIPALMLALLVISTFWHARMGLQVVVEDYVPDSGSRFGVTILLNLVVFAGAAFALFCIGRIALANPAMDMISAAQAAAAAQAGAQGGM
jgi:succinate dehydrogenase / fumarate reductase membrane anchor subunit